MATVYELEFIYNIRDNGVREDGKPSFLRQWETVDFINRGAYGEVYLIRRGSELCAVKIIDMDKPNVDFSVEIEALRAIQGREHAPKIYEYEIVGVDNGRYVRRYQNIRMELLRRLPDEMTEDDVIEMGIQLCDILGVCHSGGKKIFHCDIKPENILVSKDGAYILTDFGASTITERTHSSSGHAGTPLYMAPEINAFKPYDGRSDLYSLGVTMYALLNNGYPPFYDGSNGSDAIRMRLEGKKIPAIEGVSAGMMKILRRLMQTEPDRRCRSARELSSELKALADAKKKQREAAEREEERRAARAEKKLSAERAAADDTPSDAFAETQLKGKGAGKPAARRKRKPLGIIAAAAALVAAIVCGVIWLPGGISWKDGLAVFSGDNGTEPSAAEEGSEHFTFREAEGGYWLVKFDGLIEDVEIPSEYNNEPVTSLAFHAFYNKKNLKSVSIPGSIASIQPAVFAESHNLTSVSIPYSVTIIGNKAFYNCSSLVSVTIPDSVTSIGDNAFKGCSDLASLTIGNSVESIGKNAFCNCGGLTSVTIPDSVASIGRNAFKNCSNLTVTAPHEPSYYGYGVDIGVEWNVA